MSTPILLGALGHGSGRVRMGKVYWTREEATPTGTRLALGDRSRLLEAPEGDYAAFLFLR